MKKTFKVNIYIETDSACVKEQYRAWGYIVKYVKKNGKQEKRCGVEVVKATRNRAMLIALNEALQILLQPCEITVHMDNKYISENILQSNIEKWQQNGWKNARNEDVKNVEDWKEFVKLIKGHSISFSYAKSYEDKKELKMQVQETMKQRNDWQQQRIDGGF